MTDPQAPPAGQPGPSRFGVGSSPTHPSPEQQQQQPRKRRRRTMACTQCRSRKLRCDREYPACGRCQKSKMPTACTYEDGFLWQQPNTVSSNVFSDRGSTGIVQDRTPALTPPDSGLVASVPSLGQTQTQTLIQNQHLTQPGSLAQVQTQNQSHDRPVGGAGGGEKRDKFLETVLGAPKAAVNNHTSYGHSEMVQRSGPGENVRVERDGADDGNDGLVSPTQQLEILPKIMMRGKETKTRFNGSGIFANLLSQFPDIRSFADEIRLSYPNLVRFRPDLERIKRGLWKAKPLSEPIPMPDTKTLIILIPPRGVVDELIDLYMTYIEPTLRILHIPSFYRDLDLFWAQKESPAMVSPAFAAQLLLILSCAWSLTDPEALQSKTDIPLNCYTALEWFMYAEKWVLNAGIKRPEITALRLYILLIAAQNCHGMGRSKAWLSSGTLIKQAMLSGYHRDPGRHVKISVFSREMRRRIWYTIVELDLQIAMDRGMPPSIQASDYDTAPPLNINDEDIQENSTETPRERPLSEMTDSSFQAVMSRSLPLRLKACALMHSPRISCRYDDILRMDWELNKHLSDIPSWSIETEDIHVQHKLTLLRALLETKLGQTILCIHTPFAIEAQKEPLFIPSSRARMEAATMILSTQKQLYETSRQLSLSVMGDWTLQACSSICQLLHARDNLRGTSTTSLARILPGFPEYLISLVETILVCLETRFFAIVKGGKDYFFMSTIIALVKARLWPAQSNIYKQEAVNRILSFAQTLFTKHASCNHLGEQGMGNFANDINNFPPAVGLAPPMAPGFDGGMLQPGGFGVTPPGEFETFADVFDWDDLTGIVLGE